MKALGRFTTSSARRENYLTRLLAVVVKAFGLALVANISRFGLLRGRFVIRFRPVVAIRAEVPYFFIAFASIDFRHI